MNLVSSRNVKLDDSKYSNSEFYFKDGDTYSKPGENSLWFSGYVSSGRTTVIAVLQVPKKLDNIKSIVINNFKAIFRSYKGYFNSDDNAGSTSQFTLTTLPDSYAVKQDGSAIIFFFKKEGVAFKHNSSENVSNNVPVEVELLELKLTFKG